MPTSLELQEAKSKDLNRRTENEKPKVDQWLGHQLIRRANLDYGRLSVQETRSLSVKLVEFLSQENQAASVTSSDNQFLLLGDILCGYSNTKNTQSTKTLRSKS